MAAHGEIAKVPHTEAGLLIRSFCLPVFNRVRTQPTRCRTVAMFATDAVADIEGLGALLGRDRERVTSQTFLILVGRRLQVQNPPHADRDVVRQDLVSTRMFVLSRPNAVFVLRNAEKGLGKNAAVATASRAASGPGVLTNGRGFTGLCQRKDTGTKNEDHCDFDIDIEAKSPSRGHQTQPFPIAHYECEISDLAISNLIAEIKT